MRSFPASRQTVWLKLTKRNAVAIDKYATLAGLTPENFLKRFLADFLVDEFEENDDNGEGYLSEFHVQNPGEN